MASNQANVAIVVIARDIDGSDRRETILSGLQSAIPSLRIDQVRPLDSERAEDAQVFELQGYTETLHTGDITACRDISNVEALDKLRAQWDADIAIMPIDLHAAHKRPGLAVFDMDSTLIQQEVIDELARSIGRYDAVAEITERAMRGELDFDASLRERVKLLEGVSTGIWEELRSSRISATPGAKELIKAFRTRGWKTAVLSGGFTPLAEWVKHTLGLDYAYANHLVEDTTTGQLTGQLVESKPIINAEKKKELLLHLAESNNIDRQNVVAVGDGSNDLLMMHAAGMGIAFNAKPKVQADAPTKLNSKTLLDVFYILGYSKQETDDVLR